MPCGAQSTVFRLATHTTVAEQEKRMFRSTVKICQVNIKKHFVVDCGPIKLSFLYPLSCASYRVEWMHFTVTKDKESRKRFHLRTKRLHCFNFLTLFHLSCISRILLFWHSFHKFTISARCANEIREPLLQERMGVVKSSPNCKALGESAWSI